MDLIKKMEEARDLHIAWAKRQQQLKDDGEPIREKVGDVDWHLEWVEVYKEVIKELRKR